MRARSVVFGLLTCLAISACASEREAESPRAPETFEGAEVIDPDYVPEFVPEGGARENQPYLDWLIRQTLDDRASGRSGLAVVEALEAAGFDRAHLEVTRDLSLIELPVDSVSVALLWEDECFIGQWGNDWYVSQIEPVLGTGRCLVGETVSLD